MAAASALAGSYKSTGIATNRAPNTTEGGPTSGSVAVLREIHPDGQLPDPPAELSLLEQASGSNNTVPSASCSRHSAGGKSQQFGDLRELYVGTGSARVSPRKGDGGGSFCPAAIGTPSVSISNVIMAAFGNTAASTPGMASWSYTPSGPDTSSSKLVRMPPPPHDHR